MAAANDGAVHVLHVGARTPLGRSMPASAAAVRAGLVERARHPYMTDRLERPIQVARARWLPDDLDGAPRLVALAKNAAKEALAPLLRPDAGLSGERFAIFVGVPAPRPGRPADLDDALRAALGPEAFFHARVRGVTLVEGGGSSGVAALDRAAAAIRAGEVEVCLAGGVDGWLEADTLAWLDETDRLRSSRRPHGFTPGEGAAFCLLASSAWVERTGFQRGLALVGTGVAPGPRPPPKVETGEVLTAAWSAALEGLHGDARVDRAIGDLDGETVRADELGFTLARLGPRLADPDAILAPAAAWGNVGAASGPLFVGLALAAARRGWAAGPHTLIWTRSEELRAAALLRAIIDPDRHSDEDDV